MRFFGFSIDDIKALSLAELALFKIELERIRAKESFEYVKAMKASVTGDLDNHKQYMSELIDKMADTEEEKAKLFNLLAIATEKAKTKRPN